MNELRSTLNKHILHCRSMINLLDTMIVSGRYKPYMEEITLAIENYNLDALKRIYKKHISECLEDMPYGPLRTIAKNLSIPRYSHLGRTALINEIVRKQDGLNRADENRNSGSGGKGDPIRQNNDQRISEESGGCGGFPGESV